MKDFCRRDSYHFKASECSNLVPFDFCSIIENYWKFVFYWYFLEMFKNLNYLIGLTNIDNLVNFKFRKVDLKDNFVNNWKKSNAR